MIREIIKKSKQIFEAGIARDAITYKGGQSADRQHILDLIQNYDRYPDYIDSYSQVIKAKDKNKNIIKELKKYGVKSFTVADTEINVSK